MRPNSDYFMNLVQGADNVPRPKRPEHMEQVADAAGLTVKGRKARKKRRKEELKRARARMRGIDPKSWDKIMVGTGATAASASHDSALWTPAMLLEMRTQAAELGKDVGAHKREIAEDQARRNRGARVSDITKELAAAKRQPMRKSWLHKANPFARARATP